MNTESLLKFINTIDTFIEEKKLKKILYVRIESKTLELQKELNILLPNILIGKYITIWPCSFLYKNNVLFLNNYYIEIFGYDLNQYTINASNDTIPFIFQEYIDMLTLDILKKGVKTLLLFKKENENDYEKIKLEYEKSSKIFNQILLDQGISFEELKLLDKKN